MGIDYVISFANLKVRLEFLAMERSLRATGCDLPLQVIPYDESRFPLPENARWLEDDELFALVRKAGAIPLCRKYLALTLANCAYFDADIIHLRDPREWLSPLRNDVFVVADTEWNKARWTFTPETRAHYRSKTTLWLLDNFNSGFFAYANAIMKSTDVIAFLSDRRNMTHGEGPTSGEQQGQIYW